MYEIALREPMLPAIRPTEVKTPWWKSKKIEVVYQPNEMVVYRVVPHANVAADTKRMWRNLHKMYEMYASPRSRLERDGLRFTYREKDALWFDVVFRKVNGECKIEFYVGTSEFQAEKLKRRLENMMHVTLKDAHISDITVPESNTVVQELRYMRHDIFSLNTNTAQRQTPIATVLNTVDELVHDGDLARLSICADHEARKRWAGTAANAHEKLSSGKVPRRFGIKAGIPVVKAGMAGLMNSVNTFMQDVMDAVQGVFLAPGKPLENRELINRNELLDELYASKLANSTNEKRNLPVFRTHIRVAAHSSDRLTRDTIADTLATGIADSAEDNELQGVSVRDKDAGRIVKELNTLHLSKQTRFDTNVNLTSTDEIAKLALQLPERKLQLRYASELDAKYRIEVEVPQALRSGTGIPLGTAQVKDRTITVDMPINPDSLYRAYTFIGGQGAGKDTAIKNWVIDACLKHGMSSLVIDAIEEPGERGMADGLRDALPADKIIDLNFGDNDYVIPLDLTEVVMALGELGPDRFAEEITDFIDMGKLTTAKKILREAAKASGGNLYGVKRIIEEYQYRKDIIRLLKEEGNHWLARDLEMWGTNDDLANKADAVLDRLDTFFGNDRLRGIFAQDPHPEVNFAQWMAEGNVIILRVPNRKLGELPAKTLVHWITLKFFMTRMLMTQKAQGNGAFIIFNEPEQYASEGLTKLMGRIATEGRKERMGSLYAFHHWNKLPKTLQENLLGGGVQQFLFMNDHHKTFELSESRFKETIPMDQAVSLPAHYAIVSLRAEGELQPAFIAHMNPPAKARYKNAKLTAEHAKRFGRHWRDLQAQALREMTEGDE